MISQRTPFRSLTLLQLFFYTLPLILGMLALAMTQIKTDISAFILAGENHEEILLASEMQSGALSRRYLLSVGGSELSESEPDASVPLAFAVRLQKRLGQIDGVADVWLPARQREGVEQVLALYSQYAGAIFSRYPEKDLAQVFSLSGLRQKAAVIKQALLSPQGAVIKKIARQDPLLLSLDALQSQVSQVRQNVSSSRYQNLLLETEMAGLDVPAQRAIQQQIRQVFADLNQADKQTFRLEMTGVPIFAVATQALVKGDITMVSTLSSIALMLLFLVIFRSFSAFFQVFTLLTAVILAAMLVTQLSFGYVHGMTIALGSTLVGICIDYPIHAVVHAQRVAVDQRRAAVAKIWPSMLFGGFTTLIGYTALGGSGYPGFQQIAVFAGTGIVLALLLTRFVLPDLIKTRKDRRPVFPVARLWIRVCQRYSPFMIALLLIGSVASLSGLLSLKWIEDMQQLTPELNYLKENDKRIRSRLVSIEPGRFILISAKTTEVALQKSEQVYSLLDKLKKQGHLSDYFGVYPWLLSQRLQQHNLAMLTQYSTEDNRMLWQQALREQGLSVSMLGQLDYSVPVWLQTDQVFATPIKRLIDSRIIEQPGQTLIMIWLADHEYETVAKAVQGISGVQYFSYRNMLNSMLKNYTGQARNLLTAGLLLIICILGLRYRSLFKSIQTLMPAVLAALFILGIWAFSGALVSFLHLVGFLLAIAICVDYGIFYQDNRSGDIGLTYQAMAASMCTSAVAFGSLIVAESSALRVLAGVVALGVLLGFLFCPILIRQVPASSKAERLSR